MSNKPIIPKTVKKVEYLLLVVIVFLGFGIRMYKLTESPGGLYIDEASIGYNAWSIVTTSKDEHGKSWPLFFEAFGEYKLPVYIYAVVLAEWVLGPVDLAVRLPAVVFGTLTIPVLYFLVKELVNEARVLPLACPRVSCTVPANSGGTTTCTQFGNPSLASPARFVAFLSAFLLAVSPWHFQFTHAGFEASSGIFFLCLGVWLWLRAMRTHSLVLFFLSGVVLVMTFYSYNSARIVMPVIVVTLMGVYIREIREICLPAGKVRGIRGRAIGRVWLGIGLAIVALLAFPTVKFFLSPEGLARARQVSIFYKDGGNWGKEFLQNYWQNISPWTLFISGDPTIAHLSPYRWGLLYLVEAPFVVVGLISLIRRNKGDWGDKGKIAILAWLLVGFVPPAITTLNPHALRSSLAIPAIVFVSAYGFGVAIEGIREIWGRRVIRGIWAVYILVLVYSAFSFLKIYHLSYTSVSGWDWHVDIKKASLRIKEIEANYDGVYIDNSSWGATEIVYLWYLKYPPHRLQEIKSRKDLDKYHFGVITAERVPKIGTNLYVTSKKLSMFPVVETIYYPNRQAGLYMYELGK